MFILRIFWIIVSFVLTLLLIVKFALAGWVFSIAEILPAAVGVFLLFYLLFTLEGQQVSGLQMKDLQKDAIEQFLKKNPVVSEGKVFPMHETFSTNFDGFVVGRQIFTIMTVVAISFLIKSVIIPIEAFQGKVAFSASESDSLELFFKFLNGGYFAFASATLVPAWWCQLLSQFIADGRALTFTGLPFARFVLRIAMLLDKLQLGQPTQVMLKILNRIGLFGERRPIQIGKRAYYDASVDFYGRARKQCEFYFNLGKPTTVKEKITYVLKRGMTERLDHKIHLSRPIVGDIRIKLDLPEDTYGTVSAQDAGKEDSYTYWIRIDLNKSLPKANVDADEVVVFIEYQTEAYTDEAGIQYATHFSSPLPVENAIINLQGGNKLLKKPKVCIVDEVNGQFSPIYDDENSTNWHIISPENNSNNAEIQLKYPTVATIYHIEFETMDVDLGPRV